MKQMKLNSTRGQRVSELYHQKGKELGYSRASLSHWSRVLCGGHSAANGQNSILQFCEIILVKLRLID